jgi:hypothetical protein
MWTLPSTPLVLVAPLEGTAWSLLHDVDPLLGHLGGALEEAGVEVEDVARVRLAARRAAQEERELAVRDGLLGEIVVDESACCPCRGSTRPS